MMPLTSLPSPMHAMWDSHICHFPHTLNYSERDLAHKKCKKDEILGNLSIDPHLSVKSKRKQQQILLMNGICSLSAMCLENEFRI